MAAAFMCATACARPAARPQPVASSSVVVDDEVSESERIAAIEVGMNALAPWAQQCWGLAAADDFRLSGTMRVEVSPHAVAPRAQIVSDTTHDARLTDCLVKITRDYPWAVVLHGEAFELPFQFTAPTAQYVIDRDAVDFVTQSNIAIATLIDAANTGSNGLSLAEVRIAPGAQTSMARALRTETWLALTDGMVVQPEGAPVAVSAGKVFVIRAGEPRQLLAGPSTARWLLALTPGGREGTLRAGALPAAAWQPPERRKIAPASPPVPVCNSGERCAEHVRVIDLAGGASLRGERLEVWFVQHGTGTVRFGDLALPYIVSSVIAVDPKVGVALTATTATRLVRIAEAQ